MRFLSDERRRDAVNLIIYVFARVLETTTLLTLLLSASLTVEHVSD